MLPWPTGLQREGVPQQKAHLSYVPPLLLLVLLPLLLAVSPTHLAVVALLLLLAAPEQQWEHCRQHQNSPRKGRHRGRPNAAAAGVCRCWCCAC